MSEGKEKKDDLGKRVKRLEKLVFRITEIPMIQKKLLSQLEREEKGKEEGE